MERHDIKAILFFFYTYDSAYRSNLACGKLTHELQLALGRVGNSMNMLPLLIAAVNSLWGVEPKLLLVKYLIDRLNHMQSLQG